MISLVVHGGAWDIPDDLIAPHKSGVLKALKAGWDILKTGGYAVEAVEESIRLLEDDDTFDAGRGSFLNLAGHVELDASIMDGRTLKAGAVASVQNVLNPICLARKIMEESEHVLLVGMGATRFAREHKVRTCEQDDLITARELERWRENHEKKTSVRDSFVGKRRMKAPMGTVGAVALDKFGNIVAGASTGGIPNKYPGRVGDSPLIGCGTYADNSIGGVSSTGWGEALIKVVMAKSVVDLMDRFDGDSEKAAHEGVRLLERKVKGYGGVIAVNKHGKIGIAYNTPSMARAWMNSAMKNPSVAV